MALTALVSHNLKLKFQVPYRQPTTLIRGGGVNPMNSIIVLTLYLKCIKKDRKLLVSK